MADIWEGGDSVAASLLPLNWWMKTKTFRLSGSLEWWGTIDDICASVQFFPSALISHCVTSLSYAGPTVGMMEMLHSNLISCPVMHLTFQRPKPLSSILILRCIFFKAIQFLKSLSQPTQWTRTWALGPPAAKVNGWWMVCLRPLL